MKTKIYTVYDSKIKAYMPPFFMRNAGEATRAFNETVNDEKSTFNKHPSDFELFEIGDYDDEQGMVVPYEAKISLGNAIQFRKESASLKSVN